MANSIQRQSRHSEVLLNTARVVRLKAFDTELVSGPVAMNSLVCHVYASLIAAFRPLTKAINEIRSIRVDDICPLELMPVDIGKLRILHFLVIKRRPCCRR